jgi:hypothetical protein
MIAAGHGHYSHDNTVAALTANRKSIEVLQSLIDARADITARAKRVAWEWGTTALGFAVRRKKHGAIAFLENLGAPM